MLLGSLTQGSVFPGITRATPSYTLQSARLSNGVGFGALGDNSATIDQGSVIDPVTGLPVSNLDSIFSMIQKGIVALNAQQVFQLNLDRLQQGLPPIPTQYASPTVNVGLAGISTPMLLLGAALLVYLIARKA